MRRAGAIVLAFASSCHREPVDRGEEARPAPSIAAAASAAPADRGEPAETIGTATMDPDGTIVLTLRATGPGSAVGDAQLRYAIRSPDYDAVLRHLGGLMPGEVKPVRAWPDQ